jgi:putative sugar O-methyltransferase
MYDTYTNYIKSFIDSDVEQWIFKSHPEYCYVLEHVSKVYGDFYLMEIDRKFNSLFNTNKDYFIDVCHQNDFFGNPSKYVFNGFTNCSPTNLRYILHSLLILTYMKDCNLNNVDIIEIGGGYGGLCFFIYKLSDLFNITIKSYTLFDLQEPLMLQKKYLEALNINNVNFLEIDSIKNLKENSFLISNYAFSEISLEIQKKYTKEVLNPYTSHGFLVWNFINIYKFINDKNIRIENEYPFISSINKYVYFKPVNIT